MSLPSTSVATNMKVANITWDMISEGVDRTGPIVDLSKLYTTHKDAIGKMPANATEAVLTKGKTFSEKLKQRIHAEGTLLADFQGVPISISRNVDGGTLNIQRFTACVALDKWVKGDTKLETAMFKAVGATGVESFDSRFRTMLVPGYGFLYSAIFKSSSPGLSNVVTGDKGRYMAGGVLLDWLQYSRSGGVKMLDAYAEEKLYQSQRGTVEQIRANAGDESLELTGDELAAFREILDRAVAIPTGGKSTARLVAATATWKLR